MGVDLYHILDPDNYQQLVEKLNRRQLLLAQGAMNYHSLVNPGRKMQYQFYLGTDGEYPRLTDLSTLQPDWIENAHEIGRCEAQSLMRGKARNDDGIGPQGEPIQSAQIRYIRLSDDEPNDAKARQHEEKSLKQKVYDFLEKKNVKLLDAIRESKIRVNELRLRRPIIRSTGEHLFPSAVSLQQEQYRLVRPVDAFPGSPKMILFGFHWLQMGGAERWAFESVQLAKNEGFLPVVMTDQLSHHYWVTRPELENTVIIPMTMPIQYWKGDVPLLRFLVENFDLRAVFLHHCNWLYAHTPWLKRYRPNVPIIDSTHIVEYGGGGFPGVSVAYDNYIDIHHVISPQLADWMTQTQKVASDKVVLAPLIGLTTEEDIDFKPAAPNKPFTIAFVGRLARQKRPDIFLLAAQRIRQQVPNVRFILHGEGEMAPIVEKHLAELELGDVVERRSEEDSVMDTLSESDLLFITSTNEGLTLTALEAISAGVPVISTDVGSQKTLIPPEALLSRSAQQLLHAAPMMVKTLANDPDACEKLWQKEAEAVRNFAKLQSGREWASAWMKGLTTNE